MLKGRTVVQVLVAALFVAMVPTAALAAPPSNDGIDAAAPLTIPSSGAVDIREATTESADPRCWDDRNIVWYSVTPVENVPLEATITNNNFEVSYAVYSSDAGVLQRIACRRQWDPIRWEAEAEQTYFISVGTYYNNPPGTATLNLREFPGPRNDDVSLAQPIHDLPFRKSVDVFGAQTAPKDPDCFDSDHTVWFRYTPDRDQKLVASTFGSGYDTAMGIYTGHPGNLKEASCGDDTGRSDDVRKRFVAEKGVRYLIMVGSQKGIGWVDFSLQEVLKTKVRMSPRGFVHSVTGAARVTGTFQCNGPAKIRIYGTLRQRHGAELTTWSFRVTRKCTRELKTWSDVLKPDAHAFTPGEAALTISATATAEKESAGDGGSRLIVLEACRCEWGL